MYILHLALKIITIIMHCSTVNQINRTLDFCL